MNDFWFMNCPECDYKTKIQNKFEGHAVKNHPLSRTIFEYDNEESDEEEIAIDDSIFVEDSKTLEEIMYPDLDEANTSKDDDPKTVLKRETSKRKQQEDISIDNDKLEGNIELSG